MCISRDSLALRYAPHSGLRCWHGSSVLSIVSTQVLIEQFPVRPPWRPYVPDHNYKQVRTTLPCSSQQFQLME